MGTASATIRIDRLGKWAWVGIRAYFRDTPFSFKIWKHDSDGNLWKDQNFAKYAALVPGSEVTVSLSDGRVTFSHNGKKVGGTFALRQTKSIQLIVGLSKGSKVTLLPPPQALSCS